MSAGSHPDKQTVLGESFEFPLREIERPRDRLREREREKVIVERSPPPTVYWNGVNELMLLKQHSNKKRPRVGR